MLRIQYLDKDRFMQQVAASRGSVLLHLANGETCDLKKDNAATELFQMMDAPSKGFDISVTDPADVSGFLPQRSHRLLTLRHSPFFAYYSNVKRPLRGQKPERAFYVCSVTGCTG